MRWLAALLASICTAASAERVGTDLTDMWWNVQRPGWAATFYQQDDILFGILLVYDGAPQNGYSAPTWYFASEMKSLPDPGNDTAVRYRGALYRSQGPRPSATRPFDSSLVKIREVGTLDVSVDMDVYGSVSYVIDGVAVTESIGPMVFKAAPLNARYVGVISYAATSSPACSRTAYTTAIRLAASTSADRLHLTLDEDTTGRTCEIDAAGLTTGRNGWIRGTATCRYPFEAAASTGTFSGDHVSAGEGRLAMDYVLTLNNCTRTGSIAAMRPNP
jgi:hypothetical protein